MLGAMTDMPPPSPAPQADPGASGPARPAAASRGDKLRLFLILGGMVAFLAIVLFLVRDNQSADDLAVGTCFDLPGRDTDISTVTRHDCAQAHDAEVFHVAEYTGESYPISLSLDSFIEDSCVPVFATYVGEPFDTSEDLTVGYFYPSRDGFDDGDRTITCYVVREDDSKLTKSVKVAGT
jgi:hypothetical protein